MPYHNFVVWHTTPDKPGVSKTTHDEQVSTTEQHVRAQRKTSPETSRNLAMHFDWYRNETATMLFDFDPYGKSPLFLDSDRSRKSPYFVLDFDLSGRSKCFGHEGWNDVHTEVTVSVLSRGFQGVCACVCSKVLVCFQKSVCVCGVCV